MERCANTEYLNAFMREIDEQERRLYAIEKRAEQLLFTECSEMNPAFVLESIQETNEFIAECIAHNLQRIASGEDPRYEYEQIGSILHGSISRYCTTLAWQIAEREIDEASCKKCYGEGCRFCVE